MAFDSQTRNKLQRMVGACRRLLTDEFDDQLQGLYGIYAQDGRVLELEKLTTLDDDDYQIATLLRDRVKHLTSGMTSEKQPLAEAVRRVLREQAFTVLNRFAALRMAEERGFVQECVGQGLKSKGFQVFETVARSGLGGAYERYVTFVHGMFDELSLDLGVLFDRWSPFGLLFPREPALLKFFDLLNDPELKPLWKEDETVGWIYQYFNDEAERKKMREESSAPRNSRELAVRNQFFTPRYVVEFLTDNTLGRIWYEMTQGNTKLKELCHCLVRRPNEIFLQPGAKAPEQHKQDSLSQEDLLKQPVHIPHRPVKDPRTILMLDPACGSMHFGLYAFDLFEVIYEEAWELEKRGAEFQPRPPGMLSLQETYGTKEDFLKDVPRLIIEYNLHGIDIDPRCAQIAGLSLWLRAQKAWQRFGLKQAERPAIKRSNIVCAEPMPGEKELLGEFVEREFPTEERGVVLRLLETVFDRMQLAGEAGSLLKIEEEIRSAIEDARRQWQTLRQRPEFFDSADLAKMDKRAGVQQELPAAERVSMAADLRSLTSEDFWLRVEERIYAALRDYAEQAENGGGFQRRLFAEDAAHGFAFIDICRRRYDVVLMNPPFGEPPFSSRERIYECASSARADIGAAFLELFSTRIRDNGSIGVLLTRALLFHDQLEQWRTRLLLGDSTAVTCLADLGYGVLDAVVEAVAFCVASSFHNDADFIDCLGAVDKSARLNAALLTQEIAPVGPYRHSLAHFRNVPLAKMAYAASKRWLALFRELQEHPQYIARAGLASGDDERFLRTHWEIAPQGIGPMRWRWFAKGGDYGKYQTDLHLVINWRERSLFRRSGDSSLYGRPGATYTERTTSNLSTRVLNSETAFSYAGPAVLPHDEDLAPAILAFTNSFAVSYLIEIIAGGGDYSVRGSAARHFYPSFFERLPQLAVADGDRHFFREAMRSVINVQRSLTLDELHIEHLAPLSAADSAFSLRELFARVQRRSFSALAEAYRHLRAVETRISVLLGLEERDCIQAYSVTGWPWPSEAASATLVGEFLNRIAKDENSPVRIAEHRFENKLSHWLSDEVEMLAHSYNLSPESICLRFAELTNPPHLNVESRTCDVVSWLAGCAFGRWDIRYATSEKAAPELPDPFAPLPVCPPGQLQNAQGLPARSEDMPAAYPIRIPWEGILVDDLNHPLDIDRRVREVIEIIWKNRAEAIEHEACEILGVKSLRDYFRKPAGFFADHLQRYSKSRRQAPIYWPLSTASGSYTLWIYYHRLTDQTLFQCVNDFVKPKLEEVSRDIERLRGELQRADGGSRQQREKLEELEDFAIELKEFHDELLRVASLPYKPNLNDGVLITASPLWKLFRLPKWQKDLKACWESLKAGEYDWAHLAYTIWPDRVKEVCKKDRSIAIAHGLEHLCEVKAPEKKGKGRKKKDEQMELEEGGE